MKKNDFSRRYFLQGIGGSLLALPILPSLFPKALAQELADRRFLVIIGSEHGGGGYRDWYPLALRNPEIPYAALNTFQIYSGAEADGLDHKGRWGRLSDLLSVEAGHPGGNVDNGQARLSYILGSHLNPYLDKMNFYQGIDIGPEYQGHGTGPISGNIAKAVNSTIYRGLTPTASLDFFLSRHAKFYSEGEGHSVGSVIFPGRALSFNVNGDTNPPNANNTQDLFNAVFSKYDSDPAQVKAREQKAFVVDRVLEDYNNFLNGAYGLGRKLSSEDRKSVEAHIQNVHETQKKLAVPSNTSCGGVAEPSNNDWDTKLNLLVAAFNCGATRLSTIWCPIMNTHPDYHASVVHVADGTNAEQLIHSTDLRRQSTEIVGALVKKMDEVNLGSGKSLLDQSLVFWQHESGVRTHSGNSVSLVSFGGAGGSIKTGYFVDYRNMSNFAFSRDKICTTRPGLLVQQWWANVLQAMGLSPGDFEVGGEKGYGTFYRSSYYPAASADYHGHKNHIPYPERVYAGASNKLPIVT